MCFPGLTPVCVCGWGFGWRVLRGGEQKEQTGEMGSVAEVETLPGWVSPLGCVGRDKPPHPHQHHPCALCLSVGLGASAGLV